MMEIGFHNTKFRVKYGNKIAGVRKSLKIFKDSLLPFKNPLSFKDVEKGPK